MLFIDTETYNTLNLKKIGGARYVRSCEPLLVAWAYDTDPVKVWDVTYESMPAGLRHLLRHPGIPLCAHNAPFERGVLAYGLDSATTVTRWHDSAVLGLSLGLPDSLELLGAAVLNQRDRKASAEGRKLVGLFSRPRGRKRTRATRETHPEEWALFIEYCRQDVHSMRAIWRKLPQWVYATQRAEQLLDWEINRRGLPIDSDLALAAVALCEETIAAYNQTVVEASDGVLASCGSWQQVLPWCAERGVLLPDYTKATVSATLEGELPPEVRTVLEARQQTGRASTAKYGRMVAGAVDGRLHQQFRFYGARTGRWAGRAFQPHNMPRPLISDTDIGAEAILAGNVDVMYDDPMAVAASCIRSTVCARTGHELVVVDFSGIEARVVAWLAGEQWKLDAFRSFDAGTGPDLYRLAYARGFHIDPDQVNYNQRQIGKVMELACGYQGWVGAFQQMSVGYGVTVSDDTAAALAGAWRNTHPAICAFWYAMNDASVSATRCPRGLAYRAKRIQFCKRGDFLLMRLPSGRFMSYPDPKVVETKRGPQVEFNLFDETKRILYRDVTYGGKLTENATQAVARDLLSDALLRVDRSGWTIVGHVHDEIICEEREGRHNEHQLAELMVERPTWADGLPIAAAGYTARRFRK